MRRALTTDELALLDAHPHVVKMHLAVHKPATALACQVNDANIAQGAMSIPYDNVTAGEAGAVGPGMTLLLGSTPGASDLGRVRVRAMPVGNIISVAENSDVQWADDAYITVLNVHEFWLVFPRITQTGGVLHFYKDYDVDYSYQTEREPPVAIMGPPACAFRDPDTGLATVRFVGVDSYSVAAGKSIAEYSWVMDGATPNTSTEAGTEASPVVVTYDTPGQYLASLEVTDNGPNETAGRTWRPVFIFDRAGANAPYSQVAIASLEGDFAAGGWTATLRVFGDADAGEFPDRAMVVLFAEESFGVLRTAGAIGGYPHRENVKFVGYIVEETVHIGYTPDGERFVEFRAETIDGLMKAGEMFPTTIEDDPTPGFWQEMRGLNVDRAAYYALKWHTTLFDIADVHLTGDTKPLKAQDFPLGSSYRQVDDYLTAACLARCLVSKAGEVYLQKDVQLLPADERATVPTVLSLNGRLREDLVISRQTVGKTKYVELSGVAWNPSSRKATPIIAEAPGSCPRQDGGEERITGLVLDTQANANVLAGLVLAERNNPYREEPIKLRGNHSYLDIAPQAWLTHTLAAADNKRGLAWTDRRFVPRRVSMTYDPRAASLLVDAAVDAESSGPAGVPGDYPTEPPDEDATPVTPPEPPWPPAPPPPDAMAGTVIAGDAANGCYHTPDIGAATPEWTARNNGAATPALDWLAVKRGWPQLQHTADPESAILIRCTTGAIELSLDAGRSWTDRTPTTDPINPWSDNPAATAATVTYMQIETPNLVNQQIYVLARWQNAADDWRAFVLITEDLGLTWTWHPITTYGLGMPGDGWAWPIGVATWQREGSPDATITDAAALIGEWTEDDVSYCEIVNSNDLESDAGLTLEFGVSFPAGGGTAPLGRYLVKYAAYVDSTSGPGNTQSRFMLNPNHEFYSESHPYWWLPGASPVGAWYDQDWDGDNSRHVAGEGSNYVSIDFAGYGGGRARLRYFAVYVGLTGAPTSYRPLGFAVDFEDGSRIYLTAWDYAHSKLVLLRLEFDENGDLHKAAEKILGNADAAQVDSLSRWVFPRVVWQPTVENFGDIVYVFGSVNDDAYLAESTDGGVTFVDRSSGLPAAARVTALLAVGDAAGGLTSFYAFCSDSKLYAETSWTWDAGHVTPFTPDPGGISAAYDADHTVVVANRAADAVKVATAPEPYTVWTDRTGDFPADGGTPIVQWLTP